MAGIDACAQAGMRTTAQDRRPVRGRRALTRYRVLDRQGTGADAVSRLELKPVTGRAHQLRVHLLSLGHPILGDPRSMRRPNPPPASPACTCIHPRRLHASAHPRTDGVRQPGAVLRRPRPPERAVLYIGTSTGRRT